MNATTPFACPRCGVSLTMSERQGIEIDYCPQCRGVWLDRGELDKIIERTGALQGPPPSPPAPERTGQSAASGWTRPAVSPPQQQPWGGDHHAGFTHEIASVAQPARQRRVPVWKRALI